MSGSNKGDRMKDTLGALVNNLTGNILENSAQFLLQQYLKNRHERARVILLEEIRRGECGLESIDQDEVVSVVYRYMTAASMGAARINLRILAKIICGLASKRKPLFATEFLAYADALSSMRQSELIAVALVHKAKKKYKEEYPEDKKLTGEEFSWRQYDFAEKEAKMKWGISEEDFLAYCISAQRSGLVRPYQGIGKLFFTSSSVMDSLCETFDFEEAIREEIKS
jgi:hypothetical protein